MEFYDLESSLLDKNNIENICRYCLQNNNLLDLFENANDENIEEITFKCLGIQIDENDEFPKYICSSCLNTLKDFYSFKKKSQWSLEILKSIKLKIIEFDDENNSFNNHIIHETILESTEIEILNDSISEVIEDTSNMDQYIEVISEDQMCERTEFKKETCPYCDIEYDNLNMHICRDHFSIEIDNLVEHSNDAEIKLEYDMEKFIENYDEIHPDETDPVENIQEFDLPISNEIVIQEEINQQDIQYEAVKPKVVVPKIKRAPSIASAIICKICGSVPVDLQQHLNRHTSKQHEILQKINKIVAKGKVLPVQRRCALCSKVFENILHHFKTFHISPKIRKCHKPQVICEICGIKTRYLDSHIRIHNNTSVVCDICKKVYATKQSLQIHMKIHLNKREHKCNLCPSAFNFRGSLKAHMVVHSGEKNFTCNICNISYTDMQNLKLHNTSHHNRVYNIKCRYCDKLFYHKSYRRKHELKHIGREYQCEFCPKVFKSDIGYFQHMNRHSQLNPYECDKCGEKFTRRLEYKNHCRKHLFNLI